MENPDLLGRENEVVFDRELEGKDSYDPTLPSPPTLSTSNGVGLAGSTISTGGWAVAGCWPLPVSVLKKFGLNVPVKNPALGLVVPTSFEMDNEPSVGNPSTAEFGLEARSMPSLLASSASGEVVIRNNEVYGCRQTGQNHPFAFLFRRAFVGCAPVAAPSVTVTPPMGV